jgi:hypothetical protein
MQAQKKLGKLLRQRAKLDQAIAELEPLASPATIPFVKPTRVSKPLAKRAPKLPATKPAAVRPVKRAAGKPLAQYVAQVLSASPKGLSVKKIEAAVRKAGYPTAAKSIYNPIMKVLARGGFKRIQAGLYGAQNALAASATKAPAPKPAAKPKYKRGTFKETADQFILDVIGEGATTSQLKKAWQAEGRGGKVDNTLTLLVKKGKLKREKLAGGKGSHYRPS